MNTHSTIIWTKRLFQRFLGTQSPKLASISGYICSLRKFRSFLVRTNDSFCRFLKHVRFLVKTRQSGLPEFRYNRKQWNMQSEKNKQWIWNQNRNRKHSIVLKQSISKPDTYYIQAQHIIKRVICSTFSFQLVFHIIYVPHKVYECWLCISPVGVSDPAQRHILLLFQTLTTCILLSFKLHRLLSECTPRSFIKVISVAAKS